MLVGVAFVLLVLFLNWWIGPSLSTRIESFAAFLAVIGIAYVVWNVGESLLS